MKAKTILMMPPIDAGEDTISRRKPRLGLRSCMLTGAAASAFVGWTISAPSFAADLTPQEAKKILLTHYPQPISDDTEHEHRDWTEGL